MVDLCPSTDWNDFVPDAPCDYTYLVKNIQSNLKPILKVAWIQTFVDKPGFKSTQLSEAEAILVSN